MTHVIWEDFGYFFPDISNGDRKREIIISIDYHYKLSCKIS